MSTGRKPFVVVPLDTGDLYCGAYHCPGDCGLAHNEREHKEYASLALAAFDRLERQANRTLIEKRAEIERKARKAL